MTDCDLKQGPRGHLGTIDADSQEPVHETIVTEADTMVKVANLSLDISAPKARKLSFDSGKTSLSSDEFQSPALQEAETLSKKEIQTKRRRNISKSLTLSYENTEPLCIIGGKGCYLFDESGQSYLDCRNNVCHVGHQNSSVVQAVQEQVARLNTNTRYLHPNIALLAEKIIAKMPPSLDTCFFVNSGSEANDLALRLARTYTERHDVIVVDNAYHGHTSEVLTISPYKFDKKGCSPPSKRPHIHKVDSPDVKFGPLKTANEYFKQVDDVCNNNKIAAFIAESGLSIGGVILHPDDYLKNVYNAVRANGGVCIADEVQVGFGRYGTSFWGFQHYDVVPDIVTIGKPIGNGMPLSVVCCTSAIANKFAKGPDYFNTFGGNPVCAAAGLAVMHVIDRDNLQTRARIVGGFFRQRFLELKDRLDATNGAITDVRGSGLFMGVQLKSKKLACHLCGEMKNTYHTLTSIDGPKYNVMVFKPPMYFTQENASFVVDCFEKILSNINMADFESDSDFSHCPT